ncbi:helix-turn-helix transcriptional regulator [Wukongibacter baidiensis]|uniref:helix-turn-helix domain-containing protein n=1 Tax=Wukongibacter baidiensis TaxID=1723361 RepID=UPI003D7F5C51
MFGKILKNLREEKDLKQKDIAKVLGVTDRAVGHYESGARRPSQDILEMLADYFNVSVDYLLGRTEVRSHVNRKGSHGINLDGLTDEAVEEVKKYVELIKLKYDRNENLKK